MRRRVVHVRLWPGSWLGPRETMIAANKRRLGLGPGGIPAHARPGGGPGWGPPGAAPPPSPYFRQRASKIFLSNQLGGWARGKLRHVQNLFGAIEFYQEAQRAGVKPILPVFAAATTTLTALPTMSSAIATSTLTLGRKSTVYSLPR
jgi:hypothetical protein